MPGRPIPTFNIHNVDDIYYPSVKAMAVDKEDGSKRLLNVYLKGSPVSSADSEFTDEYKSKLAAKIYELQKKYKKYVIYTY
jgi:hypothetical protein